MQKGSRVKLIKKDERGFHHPPIGAIGNVFAVTKVKTEHPLAGVIFEDFKTEGGWILYRQSQLEEI